MLGDLRQGLVSAFTVPYLVDMCPPDAAGQIPAASRPVMFGDHTIFVISSGQTSSSVVCTWTP